jgi:predicted GNAT family N-acyltransferase
VRQVSAREVLPLRHSVLRPGRPPKTAVFAGDELPTTTHWAAFAADGRIGAVASMFETPEPGTTQPACQLRGMASDPALRGQGYGAAVLKGCLEWARATHPGKVVWCNARTSALGFYRAHGFETVGKEFEIKDVGPHFVMRFSMSKPRAE